MIVIVVVVVVPTALCSGLIEFSASLFRLTAVFAVFLHVPFKISLGFLNPLLALVVTIASL
ncbi:MAG TPA: hypothetical protein VG897_12325 [Terriglobales bacterium]|nr:hypothetical protein [Terriglobales bacterium]